MVDIIDIIGHFAKLMRFLNGTSTTTGESQWVPF